MGSVSPGHFIFVHGAWHDSSQWDAVRRELTDSPTSTVDLRSTGHDPARLGDLYADADAVRIHVKRVREADPAAQITVVAHSYAGIPVAQGLCPDGSQVLADRLVFLGAFLLDVGESLWSAVGAVAPDWWAIEPERDLVDPIDPVRHFYGDLPAEQAQPATARLRHQRLSSFTQELTRASWRDVPTDYIVLDQDCAIPPVAQQAMAARASLVHHLETSHSPFLSKPAELAELLRSHQP